MWDVASAKATNLGLKCRSMTRPTGGPPKINYGKTGLICSTPLVTQQKTQLWNIPSAFKKYGKKVQITSGTF